MKLLRILALNLIMAAGSPLGALAAGAVQENPSGDMLEQGLWWLYHLKFEEARKLFTQHTAAHPKDPAGYFHKMAADWWQLAQQFDRDLPEVIDHLEEDYLATMKAAEALLDSDPDNKTKGLAYLYLGGAEGLKGRWLVTQSQWVKAYFRGKNGHKALKKALQYDPKLYDAYMGLGIYDYFTDTLPGVQGVLAALFIHGDRKRGLEELHWAIEKSKHARVEAMMFLIEIFTWEEHTPAQALPIAQALHQEFPKSPAMYLAEIIDYYELKQWDKVTELAEDYRAKSSREEPHYQRDGVFPAWYCLGVSALWGKHDPDKCLTYMEQIVKEDKPNSRWVTFAYLRAGQVYDLKGERTKALQNYQKVLERPNFWGSHNEAHLYVKAPFHF